MSEELLTMWALMDEDDKKLFAKYVEIRWDVRVNQEFAKTLVSKIDGCLACGTSYYNIMRKPKE